MGGVGSPAGVFFFVFDMAAVLDYYRVAFGQSLRCGKYSPGPGHFSSTNRQFHNRYQHGSQTGNLNILQPSLRLADLILPTILKDSRTMKFGELRSSGLISNKLTVSPPL
jgi:hypothetical protein